MLCVSAFAEHIDPKVARERAIGRLLASGPGYQIYSSSADAKRQPLCSASNSVDPKQLQDDFSRATNELQLKSRSESEAIQKEQAALTMAYRRKEIPSEEYQKRYQELDKRLSEASMRAHEASQKLQQDYQRARLSPSAGWLILYALHTPLNPDAPVVPITASGQPDPEFVAHLNAALRSALAGCGDLQVAIRHYFKDAYPNFKVPEDAGEQPVFAAAFSLRNGVLSANPVNLPRARISPNDPLLTLSGFLARNGEVDRINAVYRKDHLSAAKRQSGIVYKLDGYWSKYFDFDIARRAFDGDFPKLAEMAHFKTIMSTYASVYSARCKDHVKAWATYQMPYEEEVSRRVYLDGHVERDTVTRSVPLKIDARFDPEFGRDWPTVNQYVLRELYKISEGMGHPATWTIKSLSRDFPTQYGKTTASQITQFFNQHTCTSAAMKQLGENLIRAARKQPSLQADRVRIPGAEAESDRPTLP